MINTKSLPNQQSTESKANQNNIKLFPVIIIGILLTGLLTGSIVYFWQRSLNEEAITNLEQKIVSLEEQISTMKEMEAISQKTSSPSLEADTIASWKLYVDPQNRFEFFYPSTYSLGKLWDKLPLLNHKIYWNTSTYSYNECSGDCPMVDSAEKVTIANQEATKIKGSIGSIGGNIPQSYIQYEISMPDSGYLLFTVWELPQDGDLTQYANDREIQAISTKEESIFQQMLSTLRFPK